MWENTALEAQSRNAKIIDKYRLKFTAKVSERIAKKDKVRNCDDNSLHFRTLADKRALCLLCRSGQSKRPRALSGNATEKEVETIRE